MRYFFVSILALLLFAGAIVFWGRVPVGFIFPAAEFWAFAILMPGWTWIGWIYTRRRTARQLRLTWDRSYELPARNSVSQIPGKAASGRRPYGAIMAGVPSSR